MTERPTHIKVGDEFSHLVTMVILNGVKVEGVTELDTEGGWIKAYAYDKKGRPLDDGEKWIEKTLYGEVSYRLKGERDADFHTDS